MSGEATITMPLRAQPGDSERTTLLIDGRGIPIGGCYGDHHREHADIIVRVMNIVLEGPPPSAKGRLQ